MASWLDQYRAAQEAQQRGWLTHEYGGSAMPLGPVETRASLLPWGRDEYGRPQFAMPSVAAVANNQLSPEGIADAGKALWGGVVDTYHSLRKMGGHPKPSELDSYAQPFGIEDAANVAGTLTLGVGGKAAAGMAMGRKPAIGIFGGEAAKTADHAALKVAKEMAEAGASRDAIWDKTGWFKGVDGKWRFEIDDSARRVDIPGAAKARDDVAFQKASDLEDAARIKARAARRGLSIEDAAASIAEEVGRPVSGNVLKIARQNYYSQEQLAEQAGKAWPIDKYGEPFQMRDVMSHDDLYNAYPGVSIAPLKVGGHGLAQYHAAYLPDDNSFFIQKYMDRDPKYSLGHEVQHHIQDVEGFAPGGNMGTTVWGELAPIEAKISKLAEDGAWDGFDNFRNSPAGRVGGWSHAETVAEYRRRFPHDEKFAQIADLDAEKTKILARGQKEYDRLAGEVESRNVQARRDMTPEQRRAAAPWTTQDVPDDNQIIIEILRKYGWAGLAPLMMPGEEQQ